MLTAQESRGIFVWGRLARLLALAGCALLASPEAMAQPMAGLTVEALIGDSVSDTSAERYKPIGEAIGRFKNKDQVGARAFLDQAVNKNSKLPPAGVLMAKMQLLAGNSQAVRPALEQAVQEDSAADPEPFLLLAEEALSGNRTIEADALFDKAVNLIESYSANAKRKRQFQIRAYRGRAVIAERRQNWAQAEADLRKWIEQDPDEANAHQRLGQVLFMFEEDSKDRDGFKALEKAKSLNADLPDPYVSAALLYSRNGKTSRAMESFKQAFKRSKDDPTTLVSYAQALLKAGQIDKAESVLEQARNSASDSENVWLLSGVAARMGGNAESAVKHLLQAVALTPSNRDVLNQLSLALLEAPGDESQQRALQFANLNRQLNPKNPDINVTLAWVLYQNGDTANATKALQAGLRGGALSADGSLLLAKVLLARNDKDNAKLVLQSAVKDDRGIFVGRKEAEKLLGSL